MLFGIKDGITKPISTVLLFFSFFSIVKTHIRYWISCLYLTGITAAELRWYLSDMNVIRESHRYFCMIENFAYGAINSLGPSDTIWRQRSGSTLAKVMAWCLMAPSHYLNQCWLIISKVKWHSSKGEFTRDTSAINHWNYLENEGPKNFSKSPRGQWVNKLSFSNPHPRTSAAIKMTKANWDIPGAYFTNKFSL